MNYEEKYKEALSRANNLRTDAIAMGETIRAKQCEIIFPELAESEDERIRQALLNEFITLQSKGYKFAGLEGEDIIAWLEKQGENSYNKELSELLHKVICKFINDPYIPYSDREKVSMKVLPYVELLEKQGKNPQGKSALEAIKEEKVDNANKVIVEPKFHAGDWITIKE